MRAIPRESSSKPIHTFAPRIPYTALGLGILAIGLAFRLFFITDSDLWLDEIWTANATAAHRSFDDVLRTALNDQHPPLYDLLLHGWLCIVPDAPIAGRYLSLLFGAAGLWMTYVCATRISGSKAAGLFAISLLALTSFHAAHSLEMRYYALVYLLALVTISHLIFFLNGEGGRIRDLMLFGLFALALLYTHVYGAFLLVGLGCAVLALAMLRTISRKQLWYFLAAAATLTALYAPFLLRLLRASSHTGVAWMTLASPAVFFEYLYNYSNKNPVEAVTIGLPLVLSFRMYKRAPIIVVVLVASIVLTFLTGYLFSVLRQPMLHERYTMVYFPSLVVLAAVFWADGFQRKKFGLFTLGAAVALSSIINLSLVNPFSEHLRHEPWRLMADALHTLPPGHQAPVYAEEPQYINYYLYRSGESGAQPVAARAADARFWYVQTEYDHASIPGSDTLAERGRQEFSGRFALILFEGKD